MPAVNRDLEEGHLEEEVRGTSSRRRGEKECCVVDPSNFPCSLLYLLQICSTYCVVEREEEEKEGNQGEKEEELRGGGGGGGGGVHECNTVKSYAWRRIRKFSVKRTMK